MQHILKGEHDFCMVKNHLHVQMNTLLVTQHDYIDFQSIVIFVLRNQSFMVIIALYICIESLPLWCENLFNLVKCTLPGEL